MSMFGLDAKKRPSKKRSPGSGHQRTSSFTRIFRKSSKGEDEDVERGDGGQDVVKDQDQQQPQASSSKSNIIPKIPATAPPAPTQSLLNRSASQRVTSTSNVRPIFGNQRNPLQGKDSQLEEQQDITSSHLNYEWIDSRGRPTSPPVLNGRHRHSFIDDHLIEMELNPAQGLGVSLRGGAEYGLGIYVSSVDEGSCAQESGLKVGDQILSFNGNSWTKSRIDGQPISLSDAVTQVLKASSSCARPVLCFRIRSTGKVPSASLRRSSSFYSNKKSLIPSSRCSFSSIESTTGQRRRTLQILPPETETEPSLLLLSESERQTFSFFEREYKTRRLPLNSFVNFLRQFLDQETSGSTSKNSLCNYVLESILRDEDRQEFCQLIANQPEGQHHLVVSDEQLQQQQTLIKRRHEIEQQTYYENQRHTSSSPALSSSVSPASFLTIAPDNDQSSVIDSRGEKRRLSSASAVSSTGGNDRERDFNRRRCSSLRVSNQQQQESDRQEKKRLLPGIPMTSSDLSLNPRRRSSIMSIGSQAQRSLPPLPPASTRRLSSVVQVQQSQPQQPQSTSFLMPSQLNENQKRHSTGSCFPVSNEPSNLLSTTSDQLFRRHSSCVVGGRQQQQTQVLSGNNSVSTLSLHGQQNNQALASSSSNLMVPTVNVRRSSVDVGVGGEEEDEQDMMSDKENVGNEVGTFASSLAPPSSSLRRGSGNHLTIPALDSVPLYLLLPQVSPTNSSQVKGGQQPSTFPLHSRVRRHRSLPSPSFIQQQHLVNASSVVQGRNVSEERRTSCVPVGRQEISRGGQEHPLHQQIKQTVTVTSPGSPSHARSSSFRRPHHRTTVEAGGKLRILIKKSRPFLGIAIEGGADVPIQSLPRIISIMGSGAAFETGDLHVGHIILEVDNISTACLTHAQVAQMMADAYYRTPHKDFIELLVREKRKQEFDVRTSSFMLLNKSFE